MNLGSRYNQHSFAQVPSVNMARSKFDRSFQVKDTFDFDLLTPCYVEEVIPGDTINLNVKTFARLATQVVPLMDNMYIDFHFFFVPNRLTWNNWEKFNGAQDDPGDSTDFLIPQVNINIPGGAIVGSIYDHFGLPTGINDTQVNALPFRAYNLIWNEWYRDQNLQNSLTVPKGDGPDPQTTYKLMYRAKPHDYFTSALPWPQKGASVMLPLAGSAPVYSYELSETNTGNVFQGYRGAPHVDHGNLSANPGSTFSGSVYKANNPDDSNWSPANQSYISLGTKEQYESQNTQPGYFATPPYADLTDATAATINQFRQAIMMQGLLELDARGGTRYVEILKAHFNVISPDFRLQRPEYLGGGKTKFNQHVVPQTSETSSTPQANLAAYSTQSNTGNSIGFSKSFVEHGYVIGVMQARGDVTYQQGLNKLWSRLTRWDFFWPKFQELGEQAIFNKEIYYQGTPEDDEIFGYQERYAEYRYRPSEIRGQFKSQYAQSLDVWHLSEYFTTLPKLNADFIQSSTPIERSLVTTVAYPHILIDMWFDQKHARPITTYGVPATLGRF